MIGYHVLSASVMNKTLFKHTVHFRTATWARSICRTSADACAETPTPSIYATLGPVIGSGTRASASASAKMFTSAQREWSLTTRDASRTSLSN